MGFDTLIICYEMNDAVFKDILDVFEKKNRHFETLESINRYNSKYVYLPEAILKGRYFGFHSCFKLKF